MIHLSLCFAPLVKRVKTKAMLPECKYHKFLKIFCEEKTFGKYSSLNSQDLPTYQHKIHFTLWLADTYYFTKGITNLTRFHNVTMKLQWQNNPPLAFFSRKYIMYLINILTFEGLSLLMIVVLPLLSSPRHKTWTSFFLRPSKPESLSSNPIMWGKDSQISCKSGKNIYILTLAP